jgi:large subunit ribosomal protein L10
MNRSEKTETVASLNATFNEAAVVVVTRNLGLTVAQSTDLRLKMRDAGASYKVAKNRLAKIALEGTSYGALAELLTGPTALATSSDPVAAAKVAVEFAKTNDKLVIKAGAYAGKALDANGVKSLAAIPSKEVLLAQICGLLQSPISGLARVLAAVGEQKGGGAAAPAEAEAPAA